MSVRFVELGPFGCRIDRGTAEDLDHVPEGYEIRDIETSSEIITVYIEPTRGAGSKPSQ